LIFHAAQEVHSDKQGAGDLVQEYSPHLDRQVANAWDRVRHFVPEIAPQSCNVVYEVRHGNPKEEILRLAEEKGTDLIVMGAHGSSGIAGNWGSVSSAVVRDGRVPVLVLREPALSATQPSISPAFEPS